MYKTKWEVDVSVKRLRQEGETEYIVEISVMNSFIMPIRRIMLKI